MAVQAQLFVVTVLLYCTLAMSFQCRMPCVLGSADSADHRVMWMMVCWKGLAVCLTRM